MRDTEARSREIAGMLRFREHLERVIERGIRRGCKPETIAYHVGQRERLDARIAGLRGDPHACPLCGHTCHAENSSASASHASS